MYNNYRISPPRAALTAVITTTVLLACTPSQQEGKSQVEPLPLPAEKTSIVAQDAANQNSTGKLAQPVAAMEESLKRRELLAQPGRIAHQDQAISLPASYAAKSLQSIRAPSEPIDRENYQHFDDNRIKLVAEAPVSTFSIDVDTGSYSNVRRMINNGQLPREDAVRVEELINYFSYDYPMPDNTETPFAVTTEVGVTPWNPDTHLLHIGIKGFDVKQDKLPASNLVFLVDVSGSMKSPNKLGLLKSALKLLSKQMRAEDRISIVVYAGASGVVLEPVAGNETAKISQALDELTAGGRTNGAAGIRSAYQLAQQSFIKDGINRVILATDGDFNVGTVNFEALKDLIEEKRKTGISLTTLGFGTGNYNDHLMEQLADAGNGNYAYIDTLNEAQKVLVDEISSTLNTIAKDVKIQVEFNPTVVSSYRLIGYENRALNREDFNNDKIDAGEIGAGHTVTALYEITMTNSKHRVVEPLRYGKRINTDNVNNNAGLANEIAHLRLRYKKPSANTSKLIEQPILVDSVISELANTSDRYRFSASVAGFGQLLRGGKHTRDFGFDDVLELARQSRGKDAFGYRGEFITLVNLAGSLQTAQAMPSDNSQASR